MLLLASGRGRWAVSQKPKLIPLVNPVYNLLEFDSEFPLSLLCPGNTQRTL